MEGVLTATHWAYLPTLSRLGLALAIGLFVGLEREWRGKEAGLRTFAFSGLLGGLGGMMGDAYALLVLALLGVLTGFLNWQAIRAGEGAELTTSTALLVTGMAGVLCGQGHTFTPVVIGVTTAALLAWKESLAGFSLGLTAAELRSAILLAILTFIVFPVLPAEPIDPWGHIQPREAWLTVILIAGIGFLNYVLLKMYGARGVEIAGFLGGLVNSTVTVTELSQRARDGRAALIDTAYRGILLSTGAMAVRNLVVLGLLSTPALLAAAGPLALMVIGSVLLSRLGQRADPGDEKDAPELTLELPFSLQAALKFGLLFLGFEVLGAFAQEWFGQWGFYVVSVIGGVFSSGSAVASAGTLAAQGKITIDVAGTGAVLASLASVMVNVPLAARIAGQPKLTYRLGRAMVAVVALGILGIVVEQIVYSRLFG